jgi:phospholipid transport system transporter-binding protein
VALPDLREQSPGLYRLSGELNFASVPALLEDHHELFTAGATLCIDLSGVSYSDSAGLALLIEWLRLAQTRQCELRFQQIPAQMLAIAKVSGVDSFLPLA